MLSVEDGRRAIARTTAAVWARPRGRGTRETVQAMLAAAYGLRGVTLHALEQGTARPVLRVEAAGERFVLKCYTADREGLAALARSATRRARAATYGLPTAPLVPNRMRCTATAAGGMRYVLYRHVQGRHHDEGSFSVRASDRLGWDRPTAQGARCDRWRRPGAPPCVAVDVGGGHARLTALWRRAARGTDPVSQRSAAAFRSRIAAVEALADDMFGLVDVPVQWVHGDCNPGNFLFDAEDEVVAILDFDNLSLLPRGFDFLIRAVSIASGTGRASPRSPPRLAVGRGAHP